MLHISPPNETAEGCSSAPTTFTHIPICKFIVILLHMEQRCCQWHPPSPPHCLILEGRQQTPGIQSNESEEAREPLTPEEQKEGPQTPLRGRGWRTSAAQGPGEAHPAGLKEHTERNAISSAAVSPLLSAGTLCLLRGDIPFEG